jgi:CheY-like chemotaxis protein
VSSPGDSVVLRPVGNSSPVFPMNGNPSRPASPVVLVVEDEEIVRECLRATLQGAGFHVLSAANGVEALALLDAAPEPIDVALVDRNMPRMNGDETVAELRRLRPELPVLLATGDPYRTDLPAGCAGFLLKPFTTAELLAQLRALLPASVRAHSPATTRPPHGNAGHVPSPVGYP